MGGNVIEGKWHDDTGIHDGLPRHARLWYGHEQRAGG